MPPTTTSSSSPGTPAEELITRIRKTTGFRVKSVENGWQVTNTTTGKSCKVPQQLYKRNMDTCLTRLRTAGWTPEVYQRDQEARRKPIPAPRIDQEAAAVRQTLQEAAEGTTAELVEVDPETAASYLEKVPDYQRNVTQSVVREFKGMMARGEWRLIHQPLCFDRNGNFLDGQHRMWAIIESGTTQMFWVVRGMDPDTYKYVDRGKKRSAADIFKGRQHPDLLQKTLRMIYLSESVRPLEWRQAEKVSNDQLEDVDSRHPNVGASLPFGIAIRKLGGSPIGASFAHYRISTACGDSPYAEAWFQKVLTGVGMYAGDPALALRNYFQLTAKTATTRAKLSESRRTAAELHAYLTINAWNHTVNGGTLARVSWDRAFVIPKPLIPGEGADPFYFGLQDRPPA